MMIIGRLRTPLNSSKTLRAAPEVRRCTAVTTTRAGKCTMSCVKNALLGECDAVPEMKVGPSEPASRSRLQTAVSCYCPTAAVVNVTEKA